MIKCLNLVGVFMIFFIKTSLKDKIRNFDHMIIKTGLMGAMGNKGSCLIRFNYLDTAFAFSCGHFAAGSSANASRVSEMIDILNKNFPLHKELRFKEHNAAFIFGDLNFRIDLEYNTCIKAINNRALSQLSHYDQFLKSREVNINLFDIEEGPLNFNPTYKYVVGSQEYDFKRKRVPSWCDRVLYKKSRFINQIAYNRAEFSISDHRPIYALFNIHTVKELSDKKSNIIREIKQNLILGINPNSLDNFEVVNSHSIKKTFNFESEPEEKSKCSQPHSHSHSHSQNDLFLSNHRGSTDLTEEKKSESEIVSFFK